MLSFDQKKRVFREFEHLYETTISNNRVNFVYPNSTQEGKVLARKLYSTGNGIFWVSI